MKKKFLSLFLITCLFSFIGINNTLAADFDAGQTFTNQLVEYTPTVTGGISYNNVAAKHEIYVICNELLAEGKTIIMISSEMEELLGMCDRLLVMAEGHLSGTIEKSDFSQQNVMRYASQQYVKD